MSDTSRADAPTLNRLPVTILAQYIKDLSIENPNAPASLRGQGRPQTDIAFNMDARNVEDDEVPGLFEVTLGIDVTTKRDGKVDFMISLQYGMLVALEGVPEEQAHPILLIEIPRLAFPFARQIVADATQNAGFPPLLLTPVDFREFYAQRYAKDAGARAKTA